jgi:DNA-binding MarR family transcriptional regulator
MTNQKFIYKPHAVIQDKRLTPLEQDYLCLIAHFENNGGCVASNNYFARYFGASRATATQIISSLKKKKFIDSTNKKQGNQIIGRTIWLTEKSSGYFRPGVVCKTDQGVVGNNEEGVVGKTDTIIDNIDAAATRKRKLPVCMNPPTVSEVLEYASTQGFPNFDAKHFTDYYAANDWKFSDGKPVRNWQQTVLAWLKREPKNPILTEECTEEEGEEIMKEMRAEALAKGAKR